MTTELHGAGAYTGVGTTHAWRLALLSAPTAADLKASFRQHVERLAAGEETAAAPPPAQAGRHRGALVIDASRPAQSQVSEQFDDGVVTQRRRIVFMFPGVGEQYIGMARELYAQERVFRESMDECSRLLRQDSGIELLSTLYPDEDDGAVPTEAPAFDLAALLGRSLAKPAPAGRGAATLFAHPALFAIEISLARQWAAWGVRPEAMIGHSLGEYACACLSGVMTLRDALRVVAARARLIERLERGTMLAVALPRAELEPLLPAAVSLAAVNGPSLCVAAGLPADVDALRIRLEARGIASRSVQASHAFHSYLMDSLRDELVALFREIPLRPPMIPYLSNVSGDWITPQEATDPAYWGEHTRSTVRFSDGIEAASRAGFSAFVEVGPGQILGSFVHQQLGADRLDARVIVHSLSGPNAKEAAGFVMARSRGLLWCAGAIGEVPPAPAIAGEPERDATILIDEVPDDEGVGEVGRFLAGLWSDLLAVPEPSLDDDFFRLGGNSLTAARLAARLRHELGVSLPIRAFFEHPKLGELAALVEKRLLAQIGQGLDADDEIERPPALLAGPQPTPLTLPNGLQVQQFNQAETEHFYHDIFDHRVYHRNGIELADDAVVFDVGANIGLFSLYASRAARRARIFAFEPAPPVFDLLRRNLAAVGERATLINAGVGARRGKLDLTFYPRSTGMSSFHADGAEEREVLGAIMQNQLAEGMSGMTEVMSAADEILALRFEARTFECEVLALSEVIRTHEVARIDLLKIDVQKSEFEVLLGIEDAQWPLVRQVVIEVHDIDGRVAQVTEFLRIRGFAVQVVQDDLYRGSNISNLYAIRP
jgi:phthiocerol/phenolphthiocerol synthesis type-I polyketide synthase E